MHSVKPRVRPYTSPLIKNPTYPTVFNGYRIREMAWVDETPSIEDQLKVLQDRIEKLEHQVQVLQSHS